jgi:hypothetical protein
MWVEVLKLILLLNPTLFSCFLSFFISSISFIHFESILNCCSAFDWQLGFISLSISLINKKKTC